MVLFELLQFVRVFLDYLLIEYLWHVLIMPLTNRNSITSADACIFVLLSYLLPGRDFPFHHKHYGVGPAHRASPKWAICEGLLGRRAPKILRVLQALERGRRHPLHTVQEQQLSTRKIYFVAVSPRTP